MECVLYGIGTPFIEEVRESIRRLGWTVRGGVANVEADYSPIDLSPIVAGDEIPDDWLALPLVLPLVTPAYRWALEREAVERGFGTFASVVDPLALVPPSAVVGDGALIGSVAMVGAQARIGRHVCIQRGVMVSHHVMVGYYATLAVGSIVCGSVSVGRGVFVGAGAVVNPKLTIGENALIASGSVVKRDVPPRTLVAGNPATTIREVAGYNDASVGDP